jgi:hypothetical protein
MRVSADELALAQAWLANDEALVNAGRSRPATSRVWSRYSRRWSATTGTRQDQICG